MSNSAINRLGKACNRLLALFNLALVRIGKSELGAQNKDRDSIFFAGVDKDTARRVFQFEKYLETKNLGGGVIVEAGVGSGDGIVFLLKLQNHFGDKRSLWAFDTFAGFPKGNQNDSDDFRKKGKPGYEKYTLTSVKEFLKSTGISDSEIAEVRFIKGFIPETYLLFNQERVALLNCDLDLYEPTKQTLLFFWPKMIEGGVIMLDEYDIGLDVIKWPGAKKAVDEFCEENNIPLRRGFGNRAFLKK